MVTLEMLEATDIELIGDEIVAEAEVAEVLHAADGVRGTPDQSHLPDDSTAESMRAAENPVKTSVEA